MRHVRVLIGISIGTIALLGLAGRMAAATVNTCDDASLRAALAAGGTVTFACDGIIVLTNSLNVTASTALDATGRDVSISGNTLHRHFNVQPGVVLALRNLNFISGSDSGANGSNFVAAKPGFGGSILLQDAELVAVDCRFSDNRAVGGTGVSFTAGGPSYPVNGGHAYGGAIFATNSQIRLTNVVFLRNSCAGGAGGTISNPQGTPSSGATGQGLGGAINLESGSLSVVSNLLAGNSALGEGAFGGAIHLATGTLAVTSSLLTSNAASGKQSLGVGGGFGGSAFGGAIHAAGGTLTLQQSQFSHNAAVSGSPSESRGGAISLQAGLLSATNCLVLSNRVAGGDGGYFGIGGFSGGPGYGGGVASMNSAIMANCAVIANAASGGNLPNPIGFPLALRSAGSGFGGGIFNSGEITLLNCTLAGNSSTAGTNHLGSTPGSAFGGAIANRGTSTLAFVTIASNRAERRPNPPGFAEGVAQGGGIYNQTGGVFILQGCIVANSLTGSNCCGRVFDVPVRPSISSDMSCDFKQIGSLNNTDPMLGSLADNDGPTPSMALLPGSPAIDAVGVSPFAPSDQRGVPRPGLALWDIGAYELVPDYFYLSSIQKMPSQSLQFRGWGIPGRNFSLMGATEMTNWMTVGGGTVGTNGLFEILVPGEAANVARIFRTISP